MYVCGPRSGFDLCVFPNNASQLHIQARQRQHVQTYSGVVQCTYLCVISTKVEQNRDVIPSEGVHKHVIQNWLVLYKGDRVQTYGVCPRSVPNNPGGRMSTMRCNAVEFASVTKPMLHFTLPFKITFWLLHFKILEKKCIIVPKECAQIPWWADVHNA